MKLSTLIIFSALVTFALWQGSQGGCKSSSSICEEKGGTYTHLGRGVYICVSIDGRIIP